jgi:transcriptional regulator with XRE-family HTH domain
MGRTTLEQVIADRQRSHRRAIGEELRRVRLEAGLSIRSVSRAAGVDPAHLSRIETGERACSHDALVALSAAMGHVPSTRLFPTDGPRVHDHIQVRMIEALLRMLHQRWSPRLEVPVYRPARGVIDVVLVDRETSEVVAGEGHSALHTVEHQLRWAGLKADSLPSASGWPWSSGAGGSARIGRLLLLRSSRAMIELVRGLPTVFGTAYPADPRVAYAALTAGDVRWPGAAILWVTIDGADSRVIDGLPRALRGGR